MTTLSKEEIIAWAREAGFYVDEHTAYLEKFAALCRADLVAEIDENDALRDRLSELLTGTANALKGDPGEDRMHDWSDLPKVAADLVAERDAAIERADELGADKGTYFRLYEQACIRMQKQDTEIAQLRSGLDKPIAWMCSDESLVHNGYSRFSRTRAGAWDIPVYTHALLEDKLTEKDKYGEHYRTLFNNADAANNRLIDERDALRAEVEAFDKAEDSWMRKAIELEAEVAKLRGLVAGRSAEYLAAHITYDKGYQEGRLDAESLNIPVAEVGVSIFTWLGDRPPAGTTLYRIEQP